MHVGVSNHQPRGCLLNRLFRRRSKKTSKLRVTGLCMGNSSGTGEFPAQMASYAENVSIWWRHHAERFFSYHCIITGNTLGNSPQQMPQHRLSWYIIKRLWLFYTANHSCENDGNFRAACEFHPAYALIVANLPVSIFAQCRLFV